MTHCFYRLRRAAFGALLLGFVISVNPLQAASDRKFTTSPTLATEAHTLVNLLEQAHYNRDAVSSSDFAEVIPNYMSDLDGQRLFFLDSDKKKYEQLYGKNIYWNISALGNIDPAYEIFQTYETRTTARINWIFEQLKKDFDLSANDTYGADRSKADWPATPEAADTLWHQRLRFELISEMMNKKTLEEAKEVVRKRYERMLKNVSEIEGNDLAEYFLSNVARIYDPHSTYFSADTFEDFGIQMKLQLVGIGALLGLEEDYCFIKEIVPGGPADIGKQLKPNDKIIAVAQSDSEPIEVIGMKLRKIVEMIRGTKGSQVKLTIQPADATDASARKEIVITRDIVKLNSARARGAVFDVPDATGTTTVPLGVITLPAFYGPAENDDPEAEKTTATKDVARLIEQLKGSGIKGLVLDLRRNGGGYLSEAVDLTGLFIPRGPVVQVKNYAGEIQIDNDNDSSVAYEGPLAVLVDRFSASASEIVTGALQNYGRAVVVGDTSTHGKGSVQTVLEMKNLVPQLAKAEKSGAAKFTVQKYYLPNGSSTQLKGIVPDIVLPSIDEYLPIGEGSLPHALVWDEIPTSFFDGSPLDPKVLTSLRASSVERQRKLEEFLFLQKNVDWFKMRQQQKQVSLNLDARRQQKEADEAFRKQMKAEKEELTKSDFQFREFRLGPPPPPKIAAPAKDNDLVNDEDELSTDENDTYGKVDVHLRESLRVLHDAVELGENRQFWASNHPPLTALVTPKG